MLRVFALCVCVCVCVCVCLCYPCAFHCVFLGLARAAIGTNRQCESLHANLRVEASHLWLLWSIYVLLYSCGLCCGHMGVMEYLFKDMWRWISIAHPTCYDFTSTWRCCMSDHRAVPVMQCSDLQYVVVCCNAREASKRLGCSPEGESRFHFEHFEHTECGA